jgi:hypothetical protein
MSFFYRFKDIKRLIVRAAFPLFLLFVCMPSGALESGIDFSIRFFDRRIYYAETDPVFVQVTITNNSPATYRFKLADERAFSVDFEIRTVTNRELEAADALIRKRSQYQQIFFREISVESGESFSFVEDLRNYVSLKQPGSYVVQARVYPELYRPGGSSGVIESNRLSLNISPALIRGPDGIPVEMDTATGAALVRERLPPDQVVEYMLTARQRSQWEKFFLYLDLNAMLSRDPYRSRIWLAESEEGRRRMVQNYRLELQQSVNDNDISVIPTDFIIEQTRYNSHEGTVTVLEKFRENNFTFLRRYVYYLEQRDGIWTIVSYSMTKEGTE